ncbi:transposase [Fusobacterium periodonticum]|uniref:transposase n=2 Tax=Fusobacterium periodonticum TaxID=860 RepID=UPI0009D663C7|nr:transposase [Fusobacterium periodonticum]
MNLTTDQYHIVWCVKYRRKVLIDDIEKTLKELLIEIINRKLEYIGKNIIKIDTFKVKASQLNHSTNEYEKKSLSKRWVEILGNKIQRDLYSAFLIKNVKENLEEVNIERAQKEFKNFVKLHNEEIERIKKGNVKTLKCMGF